MSKDTYDLSKFRGEILEEISDILISSTQKLRILLVRMEDGKVNVSTQKWYRRDSTDPWKPSKGFSLDDKFSTMVSDGIEEAVSRISKYKK